MSSQEPPKNKFKRDKGLFFCTANARTCVDVKYFVPVSTSAYHLENTRLIAALNQKLRVFVQERMRNR